MKPSALLQSCSKPTYASKNSPSMNSACKLQAGRRGRVLSGRAQHCTFDTSSQFVPSTVLLAYVPQPKCAKQQTTCIFKRVAENTKAPAVARREACLGLLGAWTAGGLSLAAEAAQPALAAVPSGAAPGLSQKLEGRPIEEIKDTLANDLAVGQYFVTGNLTKEIFADDCRFIDPTNDTTGLDRYLKALSVLFDPARSSVELMDIAVTSPTTIEANWTLGGYLVFPWNPKIERIRGHTVYTINDLGIVQQQQHDWDISPAKALIESFTPNFGG